MDKDTLVASWKLIRGVAEMTQDYLFYGHDEYRDKIQMFDAIDDAIKELKSWKKAIIEHDKKNALDEKKMGELKE